MQFLQSPKPNLSLSSSNPLAPLTLLLPTKLSSLTLHPKTTTIRMGGGPRTYPGGVSKWQWKRMQAKKAKQLLKARLSRERQIYEMRKRAELKAAVADLERPWDPTLAEPTNTTLFSVKADDQLKVLADRFQKPGGFDLWSHNDGPEIFQTHHGFPSARFFPKGVVHSVKPYEGFGVEDEEVEFSRFRSSDSRGRRIGAGGGLGEKRRVSRGGRSEGFDGDDNEGGRGVCSLGYNDNGRRRVSRGGVRNSRGRRGGNSSRRLENGSFVGVNERSREGSDDLGSIGGESRYDPRHYKSRGGGDYKKNIIRTEDVDGVNAMDSKGTNVPRRNRMRSGDQRLSSRGRNLGRSRRRVEAEDVFDMSLQHDGSYGFIESDDEA